MTERTFDRRIHFDERSLAFPLRSVLRGRKPRSYSWRYIQLDQGREGACTGFSATMEAAARPVPVFGDPIGQHDPIPIINNIAYNLYKRAQKLDEWEGESYEGSSVLGAAKAGQEMRWWDEYRWALGPGAEAAAEDVILAIGYNGPVMVGSWWYDGMLDADSRGFLRAAGKKVGGHAYLLTRYSVKLDAVWTPNSWGGEGQGWISRSDLVSLLDDDGEACMAVNRRKP